MFDEKSKPLNDSAVVSDGIGTHSIKDHVKISW